MTRLVNWVSIYHDKLIWHHLCAQRVNAPTTTILLNIAGTYYSLNYFDHVIYVLQTNTYKNIAKVLTQVSLVLFCFVLWHINHCRLFNAE